MYNSFQINRDLPSKGNVELEAAISRSTTKATESLSQDTRTGEPQTTPDESGTGSVQLDSDEPASEEEESDWPCDQVELELQYNVWDVPEPGMIFDSFIFNKERGALP